MQKETKMEKAKKTSLSTVVMVTLGVIGFNAFFLALDHTESAPAANQDETPAHWHAIDRDGNCFDKYTPASLIEISNANGIRSEPRETRDASGTLVRVDVVQSEALGSSTVTFYRSKAACEAAIAASKYIPSEYR